MNTQTLSYFANWFSIHPLLASVLMLCVLTLKGIALWKAAEREQKYWFIALLVLNTLGILDIFYIYFIARKYKIEIVEN